MPGEFDMRRMQEEAARRAREMQSRARIPQPQPRHTQGQGEGRPKPEAPKEPAAPQPSPATPAQEPPASSLEAGPAGVLGSLFQDKARTISLALLILLSSEEGNQELLFSLFFLLM